MEWNLFPKNPYSSRTILDSKMFFNRGKLLNHVYSLISSHESVCLVGPPKIGKSSILHCLHYPELQKRCERNYEIILKNHIFVYVDLTDYAYKTENLFLLALARAIIVRSQAFMEIGSHPGAGSDMFSEIIDRINDANYYPVLLLDSFEKLKGNKDLKDALSLLRGQANDIKVSYVVASTMPLNEIVQRLSLDSPFFNIFGHSTIVTSFSFEEARELIVASIKQENLSFLEQEVAWILDQAGGHPLFLQHVCYCLFDVKTSQPNVLIDFKPIEKQAYDSLLPHFEVIWKDLNEQRQETLKRDVLMYEKQKKLYKQKVILELSDSALFRRFIEDLCRPAPPSIDEKVLQDALEVLNNLTSLSKSPIRNLKVVEQRISKEQSSSPAEIGNVIRAILVEAYEKLKAQGIRSDSSPEWLLYNIMHYSYFNKHSYLSKENIASRLDMSVRTYYRRREEAIQALLVNLLSLSENLNE